MVDLSKKYSFNEDGALVKNNTNSTTERFLTTTANQLGAGFVDEALDFVGAEGAAERIRSNQAALEEESPVLNFTAGALGFLVPGAAAAKAAKVGSLALTRGQRILRASGVGAAEGALISAGNADGQSASERIDDAAFGALIGAPLGGVLGSRITKAGVTQGNSDLSSIAGALGTNVDNLTVKLQNEESLSKIALDAAGGDQVLANRRINDLLEVDPELKRSFSRREQDLIKPRSQNAIDTATNLSEELDVATSGVLDEIEPSVRAVDLDRQRKSIGEQIGSSREKIDINSTPIVRNLITNSESGAKLRTILEKEINNIGELQSSSQIMKDGERVGEFVVYNDAQAIAEIGEGAVGGVYAKRNPSPSELKNIKTAIDKIKKTKKGTERKRLTKDQEDQIKKAEKQLKGLSKPKFQPAKLDARVFATVAQRLRQSGNDQLDNTAEDASSATSVGALLLNASDEINNAVGRSVPELSNQNNQFIRVDAQQRIPNLVGKLFASGSENSKASTARRLSEMLKGENKVFDNSGRASIRKNIESDEVTTSIKASIREQIDSGKIKNFDENSTAYRTIKEVYETAGSEAEFNQLVSSINKKIQIPPVREAIQKALDKNTDTELVATALRSVMNTPSVRNSINELGGEKAVAYRKVLEDTLNELSVLNTTSKSANNTIITPSGFASAFASQIAFAATVFNSLSKAIAIATLRAARDAGSFKKLIKDKKIRENVKKLVEKDPEALAKEITSRLNNDLDNNIENLSQEGWLVRTIGDIARRDIARGEVNDSETVSNDTVSNDVENEISKATGDKGRTFTLDNDSQSTDAVKGAFNSLSLAETGTFILEN